jgi:hypothetical protein
MSDQTIDQTSPIHQYISAVTSPSDDATSSLSGVLADDVSFVGPMGAASGREAVLTAIANPMLSGLLSSADWSDPYSEGEGLSVRATVAPGLRLGGITSTILLDSDNRIRRIVQEIIPASPPAPQRLAITDEMKVAVDGALANGTPIVVAYVDADGVPHLSLRGSTHVHSDSQIAIWIRDAKGGMSRALASNPNIAMFYRDTKTQAAYGFTGRGRLATDAAETDRVYAESAEQERNLDPMRRGVAVIVDLTRIEGGNAAGRVVMES